MDIKKFAKILHNRYERREITKEEEKLAKKLGYVVVFGYSDDNMEFRGAINDEFGCFDGGVCYLTKNGLFENCECECKYSEEAKKNTVSIEAIWCENSEYAWIYKTDIPHEKFDILDDENNKWCQGIVFDINNIK